MDLRDVRLQTLRDGTDNGVLECCAYAKQLEKKGDYVGARAALAPAWEQLNDLDKCTRANVLLRVGILTCRLSSSGQIQDGIERAKDLLTQSLELFEALKDSHSASEACYGMGLCLRYEGAFDDARVWLRSAYERAKAEDIESRFRILLLSAIIEEDSWQLHEAMHMHERLSTFCNSIDNHTLLGTHHNEFAIVLKKLAKLNGKREYEQRALIEYEGACFHYECADNERFLAGSINNLGCLLAQMGRPEEALEKINRALSLAEKVKDKTRQAEYLESKTQVLLTLKRFPEAERCARQSVTLLRFSGQHSLLAESLIAHGLTLSRLNRTDEAERALRSAEDVASHVGDNETAGRALITLLEEGAHLTFDDRAEAHNKIADYIKESKNYDLQARHLLCMKHTFKQAKKADAKAPELAQGFSLPMYLAAVELELIKLAFHESDGTLTGAAKLLGISPSCLNEKKKKYPVIEQLQKNTKRRSIIHDKQVPTELSKALDIDVTRMADDDDSMSGLGIYANDVVIYRKTNKAEEGDAVVLVSRNVDFVGIYHETGMGVELLPTDADYDVWLFPPKTFEVAGKVVAFVKAQDIGKPDAEVHTLEPN